MENVLYRFAPWVHTNFERNVGTDRFFDLAVLITGLQMVHIVEKKVRQIKSYC